AFYKATLEGCGPAVSARVGRDRLIGVALGLIVFGVIEHALWPVRAADRMHARLADVLRSLAALARVVSRPPEDVDARRQLISQQVTDVQGFIESSKFEPGAGAADAQAVEQLTADAQTVFLVLLAIARDAASAARRPDAVQAAMLRVDEDAAAILEGLADRVLQRDAAPAIDVNRSLAALEQSMAATGNGMTDTGALALYRELAVAMLRVASRDLRAIRAAAVSPVAHLVPTPNCEAEGGRQMTKTEHFWAGGYDDMERAHQVRDEIVRVGWDKTRLLLEDAAVVVRHRDGSFTLDRERFPAASNLLGCSAVGFLAGLVIGLPLVGAAVGAVMGGAGTAMGFASAGIGGDFVR